MLILKPVRPLSCRYCIVSPFSAMLTSRRSTISRLGSGYSCMLARIVVQLCQWTNLVLGDYGAPCNCPCTPLPDLAPSSPALSRTAQRSPRCYFHEKPCSEPNRATCWLRQWSSQTYHGYSASATLCLTSPMTYLVSTTCETCSRPRIWCVFLGASAAPSTCWPRTATI